MLSPPLKINSIAARSSAASLTGSPRSSLRLAATPSARARACRVTPARSRKAWSLEPSATQSWAWVAMYSARLNGRPVRSSVIFVENYSTRRPADGQPYPLYFIGTLGRPFSQRYCLKVKDIGIVGRPSRSFLLFLLSLIFIVALSISS